MPFDHLNIVGLRRGARFVASAANGSTREFLQADYIYKEGSTFPCTDPLPPHTVTDRDAGFSPGVDPQTLDLRTETTWDTENLTPAENPALEGITDETLDEYIVRVGEPDFLVVEGTFFDLEYLSYSTDCDTFVDPGLPDFGVELDGDGVGFGSGERGTTSGIVTRTTAIYSGDPTNDASRALFLWSEVENAVLFFEDGYVAHLLRNSSFPPGGLGVHTYWRISPEAGQLMCVL